MRPLVKAIARTASIFSFQNREMTTLAGQQLLSAQRDEKIVPQKYSRVIHHDGEPAPRLALDDIAISLSPLDLNSSVSPRKVLRLQDVANYRSDVDESKFRKLSDYLTDQQKLDYENNMGMTQRGNDWVRKASHDVYDVRAKNGTRSVVKIMNRAYVGEMAEETTYSEQEARRQTQLEVLATKLGNVMSPGQYSPAEVAVGMHQGVKTYAVVSPYLPNAVSVREIREQNGFDANDRDESIFYLAKIEGKKSDELRTQVPASQDLVREKMRIPKDLAQKIAKEGYEVLDAHVIGRVSLKMSMYILGEADEVHNRDGNILLKGRPFDIDSNKKTVTPELSPFAIDCGLCFRVATNREGIAKKAYRLATREDDSNKMGLELDLNGQLPSNVKTCKEDFLKRLVKSYEADNFENIIAEAAPSLRSDDLYALDDMRARLDICYLAGKCIEKGFHQPGKEKEAQEFLESESRKINGKRAEMALNQCQNENSRGVKLG